MEVFLNQKMLIQPPAKLVIHFNEILSPVLASYLIELNNLVS